MPSAPRFTQKPSIQQTPQGDLLMECILEADPKPVVRWQHGGSPIGTSSRVQIALNSVSGNLYKATLTIKSVVKEPSANDGGAYRCTASNQLGDSNANINLNFAGAGEERSTPVQKGPSFVGKPKITPRDGGALILMECKVKSASRPVAKWLKDGAPLSMGTLYQQVTTDLGDGTYLFQLEIRRPTLSEAGQYRCNLRNETGETNANLTLNFQQEEQAASESAGSGRHRSKSPRPGTPSDKKKHREGTPSSSRRHKSKSREGSPKKSMRSRTATPTQELTVPAPGATLEPSSAATKRKGDESLPPAPKKDRSRSKSKSKSRSPAPPDTAARVPPTVKEHLKSQVRRCCPTRLRLCHEAPSLST